MGETPPTLTINEAAERLGTTRPRLLRLLSRPEFAALVSEAERGTKTGTRTARVVASESLAALALALAEKPERERVRKRKQEREQTERERDGNGRVFTFSSDAGVPRGAAPEPGVDHAMMHDRERQQYEDRIAAQAEEIAFLRGTLQREQESRLREQQLLASEQQITARKMIESSPPEPAGATTENGKKNPGGNGGTEKMEWAEARLRMVVPIG